MRLAPDWKDYSVIATGGGEKLERWGKVLLLRPDPQAIWKPQFELSGYKSLSARYLRDEKGGGRWETYKPMPEGWQIGWRDLAFGVRPMGFKHTGLFPEQAVNWDAMTSLVKGAKKTVSVLNLFAYTGGATVALAKAGAVVTHVDASRGMVERAKENCSLSNVPRENTRFIVDDCAKFVAREIKRGKRYDAIVMDPPSYGRGPGGELWKIEDDIYDFCALCANVLSDEPLFYLINSYTTGLQAGVMDNILALTLKGRGGEHCGYEVGLPTEEGIALPCGNSALWQAVRR